MNQGWIKKTVISLLAVVAVLYIVTGFGITQFRIVETLTLDLLTKNVAFKIHDSLLVPAVVLLALHLYLQFISRNRDL